MGGRNRSSRQQSCRLRGGGRALLGGLRGLRWTRIIKAPSESSKGVVVEHAECVENIEPLVDRMQVLVEGPDFDASDSGGGRASRSAGFVNLDGR
jgi:hypothetical protein